MNHIFKRKIKRYVVAVVMLVLCGYISVFIKDTIDSQNPEVSLPIINVTIGYNVIPNVPRAGYRWNYGIKSLATPYLESIDVPLLAYDVTPETPILIGFSAPVEEIKVYIGEGNGYHDKVFATQFEELSGEIRTPSKEGIYVYKIVANFNKGEICHYFAINVNYPITIG